ncbi:MAG TPA: mercuric reductase [Chloroflexia bacterium]
MAGRQHYDAIVIGAGQSGMPLSRAMAKAGWKTAMVERAHVGGTCINTGCTPTKTMVASARVAYLAGRAAGYGVRISPPSVDMSRVRQRKRDMVESFRGGNERSLATAGVDLLMGEGRFTGPKSIEVRLNGSGDVRQLEAERIFIDTGTRSAVPRLEGLDTVPYLDSTSIMELDAVPDHLLVLGGGYIGVEFAQMFRRFGSRVTVIVRGKSLLSKEDPDIAEALTGILRDDGIEVLFEAESLRVARGGDNAILFTVRTPGGERVIEGSHLLVATGRTPNSDSLNLGAAGIETDERGFIKVNVKLETNVPGVYALGEANGEPAFTHISYDDFRVICANLLYGQDVTTNDRILPYVVFTDPQLGRVGLGEEDARRQGRNVKVAKMPMSWVARALETDETRGLMKAVVDADTGQILGCAILGLEGGEVMAQVQLAMMGKLPYHVLRDAIFAHPTLAESLNTLFAQIEE